MNLDSLEITGLSYDSRSIKSGDLFFALPGTAANGGNFVKEALAKGAKAAVVSKDFEQTDLPVIRVDDVNQALAETACQFYGHPSKDFYLAGVTGTNGKTTMVELLRQIWMSDNPATIGTLGIQFQENTLHHVYTTPPSLDLQKIFQGLVKEKTKYCAIEVSSHGLDQKRSLGCHFDCAVFTNLTRDHLDYHKNFEDYYAAKRKLFDRELELSQKKNKVAIINQNDDAGLEMIQSLSDRNFDLQTFSLTDENATLSTYDLKTSLQGMSFSVKGLAKPLEIETPLIGSHNCANILASLLVAEHSGIGHQVAAQQLKMASVPGRLERVTDSPFFVDYAHTPDALEKSLQTLKNLKPADSQLIVVFGCGGDRDVGKRPQMGKVASELADHVIVTSDNPRTEDPEKILTDILQGVSGKPDKMVDREDAIKHAIDLADSGDVILVAGKGHETYQVLGKERIHFDDREVIQKYT